MKKKTAVKTPKVTTQTKKEPVAPDQPMKEVNDKPEVSAPPISKENAIVKSETIA